MLIANIIRGAWPIKTIKKSGTLWFLWVDHKIQVCMHVCSWSNIFNCRSPSKSNNLFNKNRFKIGTCVQSLYFDFIMHYLHEINSTEIQYPLNQLFKYQFFSCAKIWEMFTHYECFLTPRYPFNNWPKRSWSC